MSYHNTWLNKPPASNHTKASMKAWLQENKILFCDTMLKVQACDHQIQAQHGHKVLRLPSYHPNLHLNGLILGSCQKYGSLAIEHLCQNWFSEIGVASWVNVCSYTEGATLLTGRQDWRCQWQNNDCTWREDTSNAKISDEWQFWITIRIRATIVNYDLNHHRLFAAF